MPSLAVTDFDLRLAGYYSKGTMSGARFAVWLRGGRGSVARTARSLLHLWALTGLVGPEEAQLIQIQLL